MKTFLEYFYEARKNPEQNPKVSVFSAIDKRLDNAQALDSAPNVYNLFVSFTAIDKLGINPGSTYDTPLGIYSYPASYVHKQMYDGDRADNALPFAGEQPIVNIFSAKGNIIDVSTISSTEVNDLYRRIGDFYYRQMQKHEPETYSSGKGWKTAVDEVEEVINNASNHAKFADSPGGQLWYVTLTVARTLSWVVRRSHPVMWNVLWRGIGVDGCVDSKGVGIIHTSERIQAVFFHIGAIDKVERIANKYAPADVKTSKAIGAKYDKFKNMSEKDLLIHLKFTPNDIRYVMKPSIEAQRVVMDSGLGVQNIKLINNPAEEIVLAAVEKAPIILRFVKNPSLEAQQLAIDKGIENYTYIKNPHPDITKQYKEYLAKEEEELRSYMSKPAPK